MTRPRTRGFTLIELLVVIAIIAILAAILFPVFAQAKVAAKKASATSDMKQLAIAVIMYSDTSDDIVPPRVRAGFGPSVNGPDPTDGMSWDLLIQPYTKSMAILISPQDPRTKYDSPYGKIRRSYAVAGNALAGFQGNVASTSWASTYGIDTGTIQAIKGGTRRFNFSRGTSAFPLPSDTVMIGERRQLSGTAGVKSFKDASYGLFSWIDNSRMIPQPTLCKKIKSEWGSIENTFSGGALWAFMDGHVTYKIANGTNQSDPNCKGTKFEGYVRGAGAWDRNGAAEWTSESVCMDAYPVIPSVASQKDCEVPGEKN